MKRKIYTIITVVGFALLMWSCNKEDALGPSIFDTNSPPRTELDRWILQNLTIPYNLDIIYKWKYTEADLSPALTPPKEELAERFIRDIVLAGWIEPYIKVAGLDFFNVASPKQLFLVGSAYSTSDISILGTASAGRKVVVYKINSYNKSNLALLREYLHTVQHEFAHILTQVRVYDPDFEIITPGTYRSDWSSATVAWRRENGYITAYASSGPFEDFAEMVSTMLTTSPSVWRNMIDVEPTVGGRVLLQRKEEMVINYFKIVWGVDINALQVEMAEAIEKIANQ